MAPSSDCFQSCSPLLLLADVDLLAVPPPLDVGGGEVAAEEDGPVGVGEDCRGPIQQETFWLEFRLEKPLEIRPEISYIKKMFKNG